MKLLKKQPILIVTTMSALMLLVSGCSEKMTHHEGMHSNNMMSSVKNASSKSDHEQLAAQFEQEAEDLLKKAQRHEKLALEYEQTDNSKMLYGSDAARHCRNLAKKYREAAAESSALAKLHRQQAQQSK